MSFDFFMAGLVCGMFATVGIGVGLYALIMRRAL